MRYLAHSPQLAAGQPLLSQASGHRQFLLLNKCTLQHCGASAEEWGWECYCVYVEERRSGQPLLSQAAGQRQFLLLNRCTLQHCGASANVADPGCLSRIPDPTFFHPGSRIRTVSIPDPGSSKNLSILTPKKANKWFLSSRKYDPGCSSRIPDPDADFIPSRIPDPGVKRHPIPDPGSGSATLASAEERGWECYCVCVEERGHQEDMVQTYKTVTGTDKVMNQITIKKTPNSTCRLYWCWIEFIDWSYSQSRWYFRPLL
jgi:hypothetical protein